jgi:protein TonB
MFDDVLIESAGVDRRKGGWITALISGVIHLVIIGAIVAAGLYVRENPEVIEKPITAFIAAAPPPPPPPPPAGGGAPRQRIPETPREPRREEFTQPRDTPRDVPVADNADDRGASEGGVVGGVRGGQVGGVVGGEIGGVVGGTLGGRIGGQIGGTGDMPLPVGGNVKAPIAVKRVDPIYTEIARKARMQGIVIIEAVIDRQGNVTEARVLKPLGMGLDASALHAVKLWKFRPGTLNGQPVPVYYNLTVNFRIE